MIPEIDPSLFGPEQSFEFAMALTAAAEDFVNGKTTAEQYEAQNAPETKEAMKKQVEELPEYQSVVEMLGKTFVEGVGITNMAVEEIRGTTNVTEAQYQAAQTQQENAGEHLVAYVSGYQAYMADGLKAVFDDDAERVENAWAQTWKKLRATLRPIGGTALAEVADLFDSLVHIQYPATFNAMARLRGPEAEQDIAARTFYEELSDHLARAIMRSGEDGWTGY